MKIGFELNGKGYTLEYCKDSIRRIEELGLLGNLINGAKAPLAYMDTLFFGAMLKHQPQITKKESDAIADEICDEGLVKELNKMFDEAIKVGVAKEKNAKWKVIG